MSSTEQVVDRVERHGSKLPRSGYQDKRTNDTRKSVNFVVTRMNQVDGGVRRGEISAFS